MNPLKAAVPVTHWPVASPAYTGYVLFMIFMVTVFNSLDRTIVSVLVLSLIHI